MTADVYDEIDTQCVNVITNMIGQSHGYESKGHIISWCSDVQLCIIYKTIDLYHQSFAHYLHFLAEISKATYHNLNCSHLNVVWHVYK